jgi:hypothetical protein
MVAPLIPIAAAGVGGGLLGGVLGSFFSGSKKDYSVHEIHAQKEHYAPTTTDARAFSRVFAPTYQYQIQSPDAYMSSKKDTAASARSAPDIIPQRSQEGGPGIESLEGADLTKIALIGAVGLIGYGVVKEVL